MAHEILAQETGAKVNCIPYPGGGPAAVDVLAGHANATPITLAAVTESVRAGKLRALAVTTSYRSPALPQVPTVAEAAQLPGYSVESWQGYFAPAGTPAAIVQKINRDINQVLQLPEVRAQLEAQGFKVAGGSATELARSLQSEQPRYAQADWRCAEPAHASPASLSSCCRSSSATGLSRRASKPAKSGRSARSSSEP